MNIKRKKLLEGIAQGLNISEAGRAAGYGTAQSAHRAMNLIRQQMPGTALEAAALPVEKLLKTLRDLLDAKKSRYFSYRGTVTGKVESPDHRIRFRTAVELAKLHGLYAR